MLSFSFLHNDTAKQQRAHRTVQVFVGLSVFFDLFDQILDWTFQNVCDCRDVPRSGKVNDFLLDILCYRKDICTTATDVRHLARKNKDIIGPDFCSFAFAENSKVRCLGFCNIVYLVRTPRMAQHMNSTQSLEVLLAEQEVDSMFKPVVVGNKVLESCVKECYRLLPDVRHSRDSGATCARGIHESVC